MSGDADNGIHLRVEGFRAPQGVNRNAVLLDFVNGSFEVLLANKCQKSNVVIRPSEYLRRQYVIYFNPLGLKLADRRLQVAIPLRIVPSTYHPVFWGKYNRIFPAWHRTKHLNFH